MATKYGVFHSPDRIKKIYEQMLAFSRVFSTIVAHMGLFSPEENDFFNSIKVTLSSKEEGDIPKMISDTQEPTRLLIKSHLCMCNDPVPRVRNYYANEFKHRVCGLDRGWLRG